MTPLDIIIQFVLSLLFSVLLSVLIGLPTYLFLSRTDQTIARTASTLFADVERKTLLAKSIRTAIIGGIVGGVAFAALGPAITPGIYDAQVESGLVQQPTPEIGVYDVGEPPASALHQAGLPENDSYSRYMLNMSLSGRRSIENYNLNIRFDGCVETASLGITNFDSAVLTNQSDRVQVGEFRNRPANSTCYGAVQIDDFTPSNEAIFVFIVDHTPESPPQNMYPEPQQSGSVLMTDSYSWTFNGRQYHNRAELQIHQMNTTSTNEK
ncbi:hypothetical protein IL252_11250 [Halomicrobium sp. IBSBa]|uniref:hypothetical protein n=1 Tax=Halomicrobium sp. IBSBa TaxID=2778916 RepID=UPI001ABF4B9A|nr:hypothetical protein [Halomicrobium sp. IBSBa]MBO4248390.1 hypothetical protein [Halomicrobium sp. IBSBa]